MVESRQPSPAPRGVAVAYPLVCAHLAVPDLRSLRLVSQDWCKAASQAITAAAPVLLVSAAGGAQEAVERSREAYPCLSRIVLHGPWVGCSMVFGGVKALVAPADAASLSCRPFVMLVADTTPRDQASVGFNPQHWHMVVKPYKQARGALDNSEHQQQQQHLAAGTHEYTRLSGVQEFLGEWHHLSRMCPVTSLLLGPSEALGKAEVLALNRACPQLASLHASLQHGIRPSYADGLLGLGAFMKLQQLCLHSSNGEPLKLDAQLDLRLPQLRHLQLSGNITLSFSTSGPPFLHTSQLTSLTLQQILADTELQQLLHSQPRLSHLTCLAPEPANATTASDLADCTSSIKRVQRLRSRVALATDGFALMGPFNQQMLGPGEFPLPHSRAVLDHIFTPAGLHTPESIAEGIMASRGRFAGSSTATPTARQLPAAVSPVAQQPDSYPQLAVAALHLADRSAGQRQAVQQLHHRLQHLAVNCGCRADLQALLQQCRPKQLTLRTVPAITDALRLIEYDMYSEDQFDRVAEAVFGGVLPGALRLQLPLGTSLRTLVIDTRGTAAGVEVDDRAILAITSSCRQLASLQVTAVLRFGHAGGVSVAGLRDLRQLSLFDTRFEAVNFLLKLAADAPADDHLQEMRRLMARLLHCTYFGVSAGGFLIAAVLRGHRYLRAATLLGLAALALPVTAACAAETVPMQQWSAARLCVLAVKLAGSAPFVVRRCWLPPQLEQLHLRGCVLRCHMHCNNCGRQAVQARQQSLQVTVEEVSSSNGSSGCGADDGGPGEPRGGGGGSSSSRGRSLQAIVRHRILRGQQLGYYPSLSGLIRKVLLAPCVPFIVTVAARAGIVWLLGRRRQAAHVPSRLLGR